MALQVTLGFIMHGINTSVSFAKLEELVNGGPCKSKICRLREVNDNWEASGMVDDFKEVLDNMEE